MDTNIGGASTENTRSKPFTRFFPLAARILMGGAFLTFGLNGFLNFMPPPKTLPAAIITVSAGLQQGGYLNVVSAVEIIASVLLLVNCFVPLALALMAPIIVGILTFHIYTSPQMIGPGLVVLLLELYLAWAYRAAFRPMLALKVRPGGICE
jgi:uncharacterized membrane protein YphA (DoxX/SURF4 family)